MLRSLQSSCSSPLSVFQCLAHPAVRVRPLPVGTHAAIAFPSIALSRKPVQCSIFQRLGSPLILFDRLESIADRASPCGHKQHLMSSPFIFGWSVVSPSVCFIYPSPGMLPKPPLFWLICLDNFFCPAYVAVLRIQIRSVTEETDRILLWFPGLTEFTQKFQHTAHGLPFQVSISTFSDSMWCTRFQPYAVLPSKYNIRSIYHLQWM
jgi:hypothetical protein